MLRRLKGLLIALLVGLAAISCAGGMWSAEPIDVHEWGVNEFDWAAKKEAPLGLPPYMYTDKRPGKVVALTDKRVKDMPPDHGIRKKPILYFYPRGRKPETSVGIEMRFAYGYANAWWPQVNTYRTSELTAKAKAIDWADWRKKHGHWRRNVKVPDDERFELVWNNLKLSKGVPDGQLLPGQKLGKNHWTNVARDVDAYYVSNGKEADRYVFYEGKTRELPAITILPPEGENKTWSLVNVGDFPIHDVIAVYRTKRQGPIWVGYMGTLKPIPKMKAGDGWGHDVPQVMAMSIPDFENWPKTQVMSDDAFDRKTTTRLVDLLSGGKHLTEHWYAGHRDPADPQPPTKMHMLYRKEAVALEKIWRQDFFRSEGLTIIYRESTEYLDKAMPLNIYTDMYHYVRMSRCGLVLNRNIPYREAKQTMTAVRDGNVNICRKQRLLALGQARYLQRIRPHATAQIGNLIESLKKGE